MLSKLLSLGFIASISSLVTGSALLRRDLPYPPDCVYPDYMIAPTWTGGNQEGLGSYCLSRWKDGLLVTGITTWVNGKVVKGIQVTYSDGSKSDVIGSMQGKQSEGSWGVTDRITEGVVYGDGTGYRLGQIVIKTHDGGNMRIGQDGERSDPGTPHDVASGLLFGVIVAELDGEIARGGLLFMKGQIQKAEITEMVFDDDIDALNAKHTGIKDANLQSGYYQNNRDVNATYNFINQQEVTSSWSRSETNSWMVGMSLQWSIKASILMLEATSTFGLEFQYTRTEERTDSHSETRLLRWEASGNVVQPGKILYCQASCLTGSYNADYTSTLELTLDTGFVYSFKSRGTLSSAGWSESRTFCDDVDSIPSGAPLLPESGVSDV